MEISNLIYMSPQDTRGASTLRVDEVDYNLLSNIYEYVRNNSKLLSAILTKLGTQWGKTPPAGSVFQETLGENWLGDDQADL